MGKNSELQDELQDLIRMLEHIRPVSETEQDSYKCFINGGGKYVVSGGYNVMANLVAGDMPDDNKLEVYSVLWQSKAP